MLQDIHSVEIEAGHATPLKAVRRHCLSCCGDSANEVRLCPATACPLWPFRHGHRPNADDRAALADRQLYPLERSLGATLPRTALKALRRRCLDCSSNRVGEVRSCKFTSCSLHPYRLGKNPNITRSEAWKLAAAELLRALHGYPHQNCP
jgi:hypothetical protein